MGKQRHNIGHRKRLERGRQPKSRAHSRAELDAMAEDLVARGLAPQLVAGSRRIRRQERE